MAGPFSPDTLAVTVRIRAVKSASLLGLSLALPVLVACAGAGAPAPTPTAQPTWTPVASLQDIVFNPEVPESVLLRGQRSFQNACSACHELPTADRMKQFPSDAAMVEFSAGMAEAAHIPMDRAADVIRYLLAVRHDAAP